MTCLVLSCFSQIEDDGHGHAQNQWFLTDRCKDETSSVGGHRCFESSRFVNAYVVDVSSGNAVLKDDWIEVDCCTTYSS